jgi:hypothetical protein
MNRSEKKKDHDIIIYLKGFLNPGNIFILNILLLITAVGFFLRTFLLGNTFISSDNAELAVRILGKPGFLWMVLEQYGILISLIDKMLVTFFAFVGINVTEFWWKIPVAIVGIMQIPLTFFFMRRLHVSLIGSLITSCIIAILPIHIFQSRYLWGYEVFGVFFLILAFWLLLIFFDNPTKKTGIIAGVFSGVYIISHGFFMPFFPVLVIVIFLFSPENGRGIINRFVKGLKLYFMNLTWLFLLLFSPLTIRPIIHMLNKKTTFGFYVLDHLPDFIESCGIFIFILILIAIVIHIFDKKSRSKEGVLFLSCGLIYLAPLFLGTPAGITVVKGYFLISIVMLIFFSVIVIDKKISRPSREREFLMIPISLLLLGTLWGSVESLYFNDRLIDPSLIKLERGAIYDTGAKAAGYVIRKYIPDTAKVLAMHKKIEEPILYYYFNRKEYAFNDLADDQIAEKLNELKYEVGVVLCSEKQESLVKAAGYFGNRSAVIVDKKPAVIIYSRQNIKLPEKEFYASEINRKYDNEFSWNKHILKNFLSDGKKSFGQMILESERQEKNRKKIKKYLYFLYD